MEYYARGIEENMAGRTRRFQPPKGFTQCPKLHRDYEENGKALGRYYLWHEEKAIEAWKMLGGVLGPRWKLEVYRYHHIKDNPADYKRFKKKTENARIRAQKRGDKGVR